MKVLLFSFSHRHSILFLLSSIRQHEPQIIVKENGCWFQWWRGRWKEALDLQQCLVISNEVQFFLDGGQSNDRSMPLRARINHESSPWALVLSRVFVPYTSLAHEGNMMFSSLPYQPSTDLLISQVTDKTHWYCV